MTTKANTPGYSGTVLPRDLARAPVGTAVFFEATSPEDRSALSTLVQSYATRSGARLSQQSLNAFTPKGEPMYLLRVLVIHQGAPKRKSPGRPKGKKGVSK